MRQDDRQVHLPFVLILIIESLPLLPSLLSHLSHGRLLRPCIHPFIHPSSSPSRFFSLLFPDPFLPPLLHLLLPPLLSFPPLSSPLLSSHPGLASKIASTNFTINDPSHKLDFMKSFTWDQPAELLPPLGATGAFANGMGFMK